MYSFETVPSRPLRVRRGKKIAEEKGYKLRGDYLFDFLRASVLLPPSKAYFLLYPTGIHAIV